MKRQRFAGRRTFLQQMALIIGSAFGIDYARAEPPSEGQATLRFKLRCNRKSSHRAEPAVNSSGRLICRGDLKVPGSNRSAGEFYANCFCTESAFGILNPTAGSNLELHTLKLKEGTLFGIGSGTSGKGSSENAILGGTGAFAGARGTYQIKHQDKPKSGLGEIVVSLLR